MNAPARVSNVFSHHQASPPKPIQNGKHSRPGQHKSLDFSVLLESVWKNSSDAMRIADSEGNIIAVNDAYCTLVEKERSDILGKSFTVVYDQPTDSAHLLETFCRRFSERSVEQVMSRQIRLANGKEAYVETSNSFIAGGDGRTYLLSIFHDITERKQMEQTLERERGLLRTVINNLPERIFAKDLGSRFIINNNAHIQALGAQTHAEVVGKTDFDFRPRDLADGMFKDDQQVIHSGTSILEKEEHTTDRSGKQVCLLVSKLPMRDSQGTVVGLVGISRDVTERKQAETELREKEYMLSQSQRLAHIGSWGWDLQGPIKWTEETYRVYGVSQETFVPTVESLISLVHPEDRPTMQGWLADCGAGKSPDALEFRTILSDGSVRYISGTGNLIYDAENKPIYMAGTVQDVTGRRALETRVQEHVAALKSSQESLAELNAQKDRLFSILSHDLRSPFTSILGFCDILLNEDETLSDNERKEFLGHIENSAKKQLEMLNYLLDWSRLGTGRINLDAKDVDLSAIVADSITSHLGIAKRNGVTLRSTLPTQINTRGDKVMITQVFNNLISNALKFTPAKGLISIDLIDSKEDQWILAVKDTGAGIPKDDFKKLFKIEEKYTRKGLAGEIGTGLGLSVVHDIVKKHSGSITVESELGKGTTFFVRLPKLVENVKQSVLVVDDDEGVRVLHSRYLKRLYPDAQIIQASDGKEALELAKRHRPRFIVTDYSMPGMNGFEFLTALRQEPTTKDIPVFVITGKDSTASTEAMRLSGAAAVLTKPVSAAQLQATIDKAMADRI